MLAELEEEGVRVAMEHDAAVRKADALAAELERIDAVRTAMVGRPVKTKRAAAKAAPVAQPEASAERVRKILEYARGNGGDFTGRDAAEAVGMRYQGIGPVLAGMVRRGEVTVAESEDDGGPRVYSVVG